MAIPYARRKVTVNPVFDLPGGIEDVEYSEDDLFVGELENNAYTGPIRDDRPGTGTDVGGGSSNPDLSGGQPSPWNTARVVKQELVISSLGVMVVEVTFELADHPDDYEVGIQRL